MINRTMTKVQRLYEIEYLLASCLGGISRVSIARRLGVNKSTITRDIQELSKTIPLLEDVKGLLSLHKRHFKSRVELTFLEIEALHLSARLVSRVMSLPFPYISSALRTLASVQQTFSSALSTRIQHTVEEIDSLNLLSHRDIPGYHRLVEEIFVAISESRPLSFEYISTPEGEKKTYRVFPLTFEPHFDGRSVYLLGACLDGLEDRGAGDFVYQSFNLDYIRELKVEEPDAQYIYPELLNGLQKRLSSSGFIWKTHGESLEV